MSFLNINPIFLFILFSMGYVFGLLLKNPTAGKFLIFGFSGVFVYQSVRDAGLLASAFFVLGIIIHHVNILSVLQHLPKPRFEKSNRSKPFHRDGEPSQEEENPQQNSAETEEETHRKYQEHTNKKRAEEARKKAEKEAQSSQSRGKKNSTSSDNLKAEREALKREQERLRQEKARMDAERENFQKKQSSSSWSDPRSPEQVLGLQGDYSLTDLKNAKSTLVKAWHPDKFHTKAPSLKKEAEEEMKRIIRAFDLLETKLKNIGKK